MVRADAGTDPASVAFDAVKRGIADGADAVLIDTAGRLHTKTGLMDELGKVKRVIEKQAKVDEILLVLDATTGQNGLVQATVFADVVDITGIVLTKLDGTAKGGIVVAVQRTLNVPVKLVGLGEGADDLGAVRAGGVRRRTAWATDRPLAQSIRPNVALCNRCHVLSTETKRAGNTFRSEFTTAKRRRVPIEILPGETSGVTGSAARRAGCG